MRNILLFSIIILSFFSCSNEKKYVIGVLQCSEDIWREKQNAELITASYFHDNVDVRIANAGDNEERQIEQINKMVEDGVDMLIISPITMSTIAPAVEKAYDKGIPVILVDRRTSSDKYTTFIHADNYAIGRTIGNYIGQRLGGKGRVAEICGLIGSSPAQERHKGFKDAMKNYPDIEIVSSSFATWQEESGKIAMDSLLAEYDGKAIDITTGKLVFDCVFGHNDRMTMGARRSYIEHINKVLGKASSSANDSISYGKLPIFVGIDALRGKGQGIECVKNGIFDATMIYPTEGDKIMQVAMDILEGKPYETDYLLQSAIVTAENAEVMMLQADEMDRQQQRLQSLHNKVNTYIADYNHQKIYLIFSVITIFLVIVSFVLIYRSVMIKRRMNEAAANEKLKFFTNVSHEFRTPLTLIAAPLERVLESNRLSVQDRSLLEMMQKNIAIMLKLVDDILDFRNRNESKDFDDVFRHQEYVKSDVAVNAMKTITRPDDGKRDVVLVVDDNDDIRQYLSTILGDEYNVIVAADGKEGLNAALKSNPAAIISDVMMPVMDGIELCKRIKEDDSTCHIPVLLLTAKAMDSQRQEGYESGADAYLTKPFNSKVVLMRVRNLINNRRRLRDAFSAVVDKKSSTAAAVSTDKNEDVSSSADIEFATKFRNIVVENMSNTDLNVEYIGQQMGLSRVQLYRKVKALTGNSPVEIIRITRLKKAERLLATTDRTVAEVAYDVGFSSQSYFTRCFKEYFGRTPGEKE